MVGIFRPYSPNLYSVLIDEQERSNGGFLDDDGDPVYFSASGIRDPRFSPEVINGIPAYTSQETGIQHPALPASSFRLRTLIKSMTRYDPNLRPTVRQALDSIRRGSDVFNGMENIEPVVRNDPTADQLRLLDWRDKHKLRTARALLPPKRPRGRGR